MSDRRMSWWNGKKLPFPIETDAPHGNLEKNMVGNDSGL